LRLTRKPWKFTSRQYTATIREAQLSDLKANARRIAQRTAREV
jgi:hypothetical protein